MLTVRVIFGFVAMAMGAAAVLALPGFSPRADAGTSVIAAAPSSVNAKTDRIEVQSAATECPQRAWPYYEVTCMRDGKQGQGRTVRLVTTDRISEE